MPIQVRPSDQRGYFDYEWLQTYHTFSFAKYDDPAYRGFRSLRVLNEDRVRPGTGFPVHSHQNMEIFSVVVAGGLTHQDDLGNASILRRGQMQILSAGQGITHSEVNASDKEAVHFLQVWILPHTQKLRPSYEEKFFPPSLQYNKWCLILSSDAREGSLLIHQDVNVYLSQLDAGRELEYDLGSNRYGWIQIIKGEIDLNGVRLKAGDGAAISETQTLHVKAHPSTELLFLDLK